MILFAIILRLGFGSILNQTDNTETLRRELRSAAVGKIIIENDSYLPIRVYVEEYFEIIRGFVS